MSMFSRTTVIFYVFISLALTGCTIGKKASSALDGRGLTGPLTLFESQLVEGYAEYPVRTFNIEVLALQEDGLLMLANDKVILLAYEKIKYLNLKHVPTKRFKKNMDAAEAKAYLMKGTGNKIKLLSRFPQGVTPALLARLLAAYNQDELVVIQ